VALLGPVGGRFAMSAIRVSTDLARTGTEVGWSLE